MACAVTNLQKFKPYRIQKRLPLNERSRKYMCFEIWKIPWQALNTDKSLQNLKGEDTVMGVSVITLTVYFSLQVLSHIPILIAPLIFWWNINQSVSCPTSVSALLLNNKTAISRWPSFDAKWNGVQPFLVWHSTLAFLQEQINKGTDMVKRYVFQGCSLAKCLRITS